MAAARTYRVDELPSLLQDCFLPKFRLFNAVSHLLYART